MLLITELIVDIQTLNILVDLTPRSSREFKQANAARPVRLFAIQVSDEAAKRELSAETATQTRMGGPQTALEFIFPNHPH